MWNMYENSYSKWVYGPHPVHSTEWKNSLQTTTCFTGDSKKSTLLYSTNPINLSWDTNNSGCGLLRIHCHKNFSLQRVLPEMGGSALSKRPRDLEKSSEWLLKQVAIHLSFGFYKRFFKCWNLQIGIKKSKCFFFFTLFVILVSSWNIFYTFDIAMLQLSFSHE